MNIATGGVDLPKNVFQVHGIDEYGEAVLRKQLRRDQVVRFFVNLPPCLIGMAAEPANIVGDLCDDAELLMRCSSEMPKVLFLPASL